ncbi:MAG: hypothetical protein AAF802_18650 [Planctomycetota bacterium]
MTLHNARRIAFADWLSQGYAATIKHPFTMRFRTQQLLAVMLLFAAILASGIVESLLMPERLWKVITVEELTGAKRNDYIVTIQHSHDVRTINLGDTVLFAEHDLELPEVGSYVKLRRHMPRFHGVLPFVPSERSPVVWSVIAMSVSFLCAAIVVFGFAIVRWFTRRQIYLFRERKMIDQVTGTAFRRDSFTTN